MASPFLFYYPDGGLGSAGIGSLETIDLIDPYLSDLQEEPIVEAETSMTWAGRHFTNMESGRLRVRVTLERFTTFDLAEKLETLQSHLARGGYVSVAADKDKVFATFATALTTRGDTTVRVADNAFKNYTTSSVFAANDRINICSPNPECKREYVRLSSVSGHVLTLLTPVRYSRQIEPVMVRHRDFYPVMVLAPDERSRPIVTHDHRISWSLDMTLEEDLAGYASLWSGLTTGQVGDAANIDSGNTLEDLSGAGSQNFDPSGTTTGYTKFGGL